MVSLLHNLWFILVIRQFLFETKSLRMKPSKPADGNLYPYVINYKDLEGREKINSRTE